MTSHPQSMLTPPLTPTQATFYMDDRPINDEVVLAAALVELGFPLRAEPDAPEFGIWLVDFPDHAVGCSSGFSADGHFRFEVERP